MSSATPYPLNYGTSIWFVGTVFLKTIDKSGLKYYETSQQFDNKVQVYNVSKSIQQTTNNKSFLQNNLKYSSDSKIRLRNLPVHLLVLEFGKVFWSVLSTDVKLKRA